MDIEPLKTIMNSSSNKKDTLLNFLEKNIRKQIIKLEYEDKDFYINDKIYCIKKNTLELEYIGNIYCFDNNNIGLKINKYNNVNINSNKYYIFVRIKSNDMKKRDFYNSLLEQL
tara:strand:+ start:130 stop:471 length:342 start_codon:yes stop_codon:yes gene_type:complete